jgi:hypothetical protein
MPAPYLDRELHLFRRPSRLSGETERQQSGETPPKIRLRGTHWCGGHLGLTSVFWGGSFVSLMTIKTRFVQSILRIRQSRLSLASPKLYSVFVAGLSLVGTLFRLARSAKVDNFVVAHLATIPHLSV